MPSDEASHCELSQHSSTQQQQQQQHVASPPCSSNQSAAHQASSALHALLQNDKLTPRSQRMAQRRSVLLRPSEQRKHKLKSSAVRDRAGPTVRLLTHRAARVSHACRTARLVRLSVGIRKKDNIPRQPLPALKAGRAAHGSDGARTEGHAPSGWHLHSLRLLRVPHARASMRASSRGRILASAHHRTGLAAQAQPSARGNGSSKPWRGQPGPASGDCRAMQMPLPAQRPPRPSAMTHCRRRDEHLCPRCAAHVIETHVHCCRHVISTICSFVCC